MTDSSPLDPKRIDPPTVLLVDDEETLRETIRYNLVRDGYRVDQADDGLKALQMLRDNPPDAVILDIMLPGMDGLDVCRAIRAESSVPVLLLSAKGEEIDRVVGLEIGADDYLVKPFAMRELLARTRAMIRRGRMPVHDPSEKPVVSVPRQAGVLLSGRLEIDVPRRRAAIDGEPVSLKPKEFDLLLYFARHPGVVLSRDALLREVWGYEFRMDTRTVDVHVSWLRQKLEIDPSKPVLIETVRGYGYRLEPGGG